MDAVEIKRGYWEVYKGKYIHYMKAGDGKQPLLLLHGLATSMEQWIPEIEIWLRNRDFTIYSFSFPGCGFSDLLDQKKMNMDFMPVFIEKFVQAFRIKNPIVIGGSFGGFAAIEYVRRFQANVKKLVLISSAGLGKEVNTTIRLASVPLVGEFIYFLHKDKKVPHNIGVTLHFLRAGVNIFGQKRKTIRLDYLKSIVVPVLVLHGRNDNVFPVAHSIHAAEIFPNARLYIFEDAGHWPPDEHREEFCDMVREFARE